MLIGLQNVTFEFGARAIVTDASWHIQPGERIGLIGYNGTGKSTLLKLLVGQYTPSKGTVEKGRDTTIGYLHQDLLSFDTSETITEVALGAFERVRALEKEIEALGIALEANPEDMIQESMGQWKSLGVNRLSVGIQSLNDDELEWMNRSHTVKQAIQSLLTAREIGFTNFSIDLIYGSEKKSLMQWQQELDWVNSIGVNHLSCYALTIEENTPFGKWAKSNKLNTPPDEHAEEQFLYLSQWASQNNWEHYEISNLSKPGHQAIHNSNYWAGLPYLGIGPSAHSYDGKSRRWNISNNALYISGIQNGTPTFTEEILSTVDVVNELLLTQLRLTKGVNIQQINLLYPGFEKLKRPIIEKLIGNFQIVEHNGHWSIPSAARFLADAITVELMLDEN